MLTKLKFFPKIKFGPISAILITYAVFFGSQVVVGLLVSLYVFLSGQTTDQVISTLENSINFQFSYLLLAQLATLGLLVWFMRRLSVSFKTIGLGRSIIGSDFFYAFAAFIFYFVIAGLVLGLVGQFLPSINLDQEQQIGFEGASGFIQLAMVFVSLVILPPIIEEILIRGFLYSGLRVRLTKIVAALIASIVFGIAHLQLGSGSPPLYVAAIDTFVLSLVLIYLREKTGSLWAGMFVHGMKNGLAFLALFILNYN